MSNADYRALRRMAFTMVAISVGVVSQVSLPFSDPPAEAASQAQAQPSPSPRVTASPQATRTPEQELQELQTDKLQRENDLLELQQRRVRQEMEINNQLWRAPAEAVAAVGPTLVGVGLLYLLSRALSHWLPPAPERPRPGPESLEEDDEL